MPRHLPHAVNCPICGLRPVIGQCEPWEKEWGTQPWYAVCYNQQPHEHCVGTNGDSLRDVTEAWNAETIVHQQSARKD